jgi:hypothetical protein
MRKVFQNTIFRKRKPKFTSNLPRKQHQKLIDLKSTILYYNSRYSQEIRITRVVSREGVNRIVEFDS